LKEPFPPAFREVLRQILRRAPQLRGARETEARARRRTLAQSGTFAGHREYAPGDDLRYVDWNAYARTGDIFLKILEEEDRRTLTICLDSTASMTTGDPVRFRGALRLAAILGGLALVRLDGIRLLAGGKRDESFAGGAAVAHLLEALARTEVVAEQPIDLIGVPLERGGLGKVVWISDFATPEAVAPALHLLRRHGVRCSGWLPAIVDDTAPRLDGWVRFRDPETGEEQAIEVDAALRAAMVEELRLLARHQDAVFAAAGYPLVRFPLPAAGDFRMSSWWTGPWTYRL